MTAFTTRITDGEQRRRISSRSPLKVFVPTPDGSQYVSDFSGNYWPYRTLTVTDVTTDRKRAQRTADRTCECAVVDTRPAGSNFTDELYGVGESLGAEYVLPIVHTATSREAVAQPVDTYQNYDFTHQPTLVTPVPHPYTMTISCLSRQLCNRRHTRHRGMTDTSHPTDFVLRGLGTHAFTWESLHDAITTLQATLSGETNISLHEPPLTSDLVRFMRANSGVIQSVILPAATDSLPQKAVKTAGPDKLEQSFSTTGADFLRSQLSPHVRVAAELSLLCSDYLDIETESEFRALIAESVFPTESSSHLPVSESEQSQETLTSHR